MSTNLSSTRTSAESLVKFGSDAAKEYFRTSLNVSTKDDNSFVSQADQSIEKAIIKQIKAKHPDHAVYGEETGGSLENGKPTWIIDPIEGTTNFLHHIPVFGTQVALMHQNQIQVAAMYDPISQTLVSAVKNQGTTINQKKVALKPVPLNQTSLLFDTGRNKTLNNRFLKSGIIENFRSYRRLGSLVTDCMFLLNHHLSAYFAFSLKIYDAAPTSLILKEAGYAVVDHSLKDWSPQKTVSLFAYPPSQQADYTKLLHQLHD